jgi:hypothetical protein
VLFKNAEILDVVQRIDLGSSVAELDPLLEGARIETSAFTDLINDKVDLVPGTKGSGKSALFRIFTDFLPQVLLLHKKVVVAHGVQKQGDLIFQAYKDEFEKLSEDDFVDFWCIYLVSLAHEHFIKGPRYAHLLVDAKQEITAFQKACENANIPEIKAEKSFREILGWVLSALKKFAPRLSYELPQDAGTIELDLFGRPAQPEPKANKDSREQSPPVYVIEIKETLEAVLRKTNVAVWLMVDRLDELFPRRSQVESRALRGLLRAIRIFSAEQIRVKVFLRDDMLDNLLAAGEGFTALTHLTARQADTLKWSEDQILNLIVRRLFVPQALRNLLGVDGDKLTASFDYRRDAFYKVFPQTVHRGTRQSTTLRWIYSHCCDARGVVTPRDVIDLLTKAKQRRQDELKDNVAGESEVIIGASAIRYGFEQLSIKKKQTYLQAEFPHLWPFIEKFEGGKSSLSEATIQRVLGNKTKSVVTDLVAIGVLSVTKRGGECTYTFPYLYRKGLALTQGSDDEDDEE